MNQKIKISQLPAKGSNLAAQDLLEIAEFTGTGYISKSITGQEIIDAIPVPPSGITIGTTAITSGTVGRVLFQGTGNVVQQSSSLFWDATNNRLGIGTETPSSPLHVIGSATSGFDAIRFKGQYSETGYLATSNGAVYFASGAGVTGSFLELSSAIANLRGGTTAVTFTVGSERMRVNNAGNVLIGTTTDAGFRLDVNGTARVQNTLTVTKGAGNFFTFEAAANGSDLSIRFFKTGQLDVSLSTRNAVNVGALQISDGLGLNGGFVATRLAANAGIIAIGNTSGDSLLHVASSSGFSSYVSFREQGAADRGIVGFQNGTSYLQIRTNGATNMSNGTLSTAFFSTGNVGINTTTDAGFRLDVNGTARVRTTDTSTPLNIAHSGSVGIQIEANANGYRMRLASTSTFSDISTPDSYLTLNQNGQRVVIGSSTIYNSAQLAVDSTTRGFLPPRMTTTQRNAIASPAAGLVVYDNTDNKHYGYNGTTWNAFY